jgi:hypothetical protein
MIRALIRADHWALERAMRIWALTDDSVLESVRRRDERVLSEVRQAFIDCGFDDDEARLRSSLLFAAGVGLLHDHRAAQDAPMGARVLDLMLRR